MVLFAVIDILGAIPIIISLREKNQKIEAGKAAIVSFVILVAFCLSGRHYWDYSMSIFSSFAVAGALVLLVLAVEMIFGVEIFKNDSPCGSATTRSAGISFDCRGGFVYHFVVVAGGI